MRSFEQRKKDSTANTNFFSPKIQTKLKMGSVGDKHEIEADNVADKVVNKTSSGSGLLQSKSDEDVQQKPISDSISSVQLKEEKKEDTVQKKEKEDDKKVQKKEKKEEDKAVQAKCDNCENEDKVQKKEKEEDTKVQNKVEKSSNEIQDNKLEEKLNNSKGSGASLDKKTKNEMESGFGTDFSNVKIHTDSNATQMSQEIGAQAFTSGNDVYFNKGKYNPDSKDGKHLLAHELTHTVQQGNGNKIQQKPTPKKASRKRIPITAGDFNHQLHGRFKTNDGTPRELIITSRDNRKSFTGCNAFEVVIDGSFKVTVNSNAKNETITTTTINISDLPSGPHNVYLTIPPECSGSIHANIYAR